MRKTPWIFGWLAVAAIGSALMAAPARAVPTGAVPASQQEPQAADPETRVVVSLADRFLWVVQAGDTIFSAPVAIGKGGVFEFAGRRYEFRTPTGVRHIQAKLNDPSWVPPDWHYYEKAVQRGLEPVHLEPGDMIELSDGTFLQVRDREVGRINRWGYWHPFTPGSEIIFDGKIFVPPLGSPQRRIPDALGPVKLMLGDGYLIHGTHRYNQESIGSAASHGCIRMRNADVLTLRDLVAVGTPVQIY